MSQFTVFILSGIIALLALQAMVFYQAYHPTNKEASDGEANPEQ